MADAYQHIKHRQYTSHVADFGNTHEPGTLVVWPTTYPVLFLRDSTPTPAARAYLLDEDYPRLSLSHLLYNGALLVHTISPIGRSAHTTSTYHDVVLFTTNQIGIGLSDWSRKINRTFIAHAIGRLLALMRGGPLDQFARATACPPFPLYFLCHISCMLVQQKTGSGGRRKCTSLNVNSKLRYYVTASLCPT